MNFDFNMACAPLKIFLALYLVNAILMMENWFAWTIRGDNDE